MMRLLLIVVLGFFVGCSLPREKPVEKVPDGRVLAGAHEAFKRVFPEHMERTLWALATSVTDKRVSIELHSRGDAVRVSVTGDLTRDQTFAIGVSLCNILVMYYDDVCVTVNNGMFKPNGPRPDDGTIEFRRDL